MLYLSDGSRLEQPSSLPGSYRLDFWQTYVLPFHLAKNSSLQISYWCNNHGDFSLISYSSLLENYSPFRFDEIRSSSDFLAYIGDADNFLIDEQGQALLGLKPKDDEEHHLLILKGEKQKVRYFIHVVAGPDTDKDFSSWHKILQLQLQQIIFFENVIHAQLFLLELKDSNESIAHVKLIAENAQDLYLGWCAEKQQEPDLCEIECLYIASLLHDIGKVPISDVILNKKGALTNLERQNVRKHSYLGYTILNQYDPYFCNRIKETVLHHHEHWDGTGYPGTIDKDIGYSLKWTGKGRTLGLRNEEIPFLARVLCIADSFVSLTHVRHYRSDLSRDKALTVMEKARGSQFEPELLDCFIRIKKAEIV